MRTLVCIIQYPNLLPDCSVHCAFAQKDEQHQTAQGNGTQAHAHTPAAAQEAIEISVNLPGGKSGSPTELLFLTGSPQQQEATAASASEEEWEDAETGQAVHLHSKVQPVSARECYCACRLPLHDGRNAA